MLNCGHIELYNCIKSTCCRLQIYTILTVNYVTANPEGKKVNLLRVCHGSFELYFYILLGSWFLSAFWSNKIVTFPYLSEKQKYCLFKICVLIIFVLLHKRSTLCWLSFVPLLWDNLLQYWFIRVCKNSFTIYVCIYVYYIMYCIVRYFIIFYNFYSTVWLPWFDHLFVANTRQNSMI